MGPVEPWPCSLAGPEVGLWGRTVWNRLGLGNEERLHF